MILAVGSAVGAGEEPASLRSVSFGTLKDGREVAIHALKNANGMEIRITEYGAAVVSWKAKDREGKFDDVILGFDSLAAYEGPHPFFGVMVGRFANRISGAKFLLDGVEYRLEANDGPNSCHSGKANFSKKLWKTQSAAVVAGEPRVVLAYTSPDGEGGFPGTVVTTVTYALTTDDALRIHVEATTDRPTVINLTNHSYFNLAGHGRGPITGHIMQMECEHYTPTDARLIPTGELATVRGTPLDFLTPRQIGSRIAEVSAPPLSHAQGYDHNLLVTGPVGTLRKAAHVLEPVTGRTLECLTTKPAVHLYTMNHVKTPILGKEGRTYERQAGFCLETQHVPDSPNRTEFPSTVLRPGKSYEHTCVYRMGVAP